MAYAFKVNRVTISGTSFGGEEEWSTGFFLVSETADVLPPTDQGAADIGAAWQTFFTSATSRVGVNWQTTQVKIATLNTSGTTDTSSVKYYNYGTPISGAYSTNNYPPQIALVASLVAGVPRGLASKGRMYLPGINAAVDTNGRITTTDRGTITTNLQTFFNAINSDADVGNTLGNASFGSTTPTVQAGINRVVTTLRIGNVFDTQRRRRNGLAEAYSTATITP